MKKTGRITFVRTKIALYRCQGGYYFFPLGFSAGFGFAFFSPSALCGFRLLRVGGLGLRGLALRRAFRRRGGLGGRRLGGALGGGFRRLRRLFLRRAGAAGISILW